MAGFPVTRAGAILAVSDFQASLAFYRDRLGLEVHPAEDRPGVAMAAPGDPTQAAVVLVIEVPDALATHAVLAAEDVAMLAEPFSPPWGGCRFFCVDPDGYLVEIEQPA